MTHDTHQPSTLSLGHIQIPIRRTILGLAIAAAAFTAGQLLTILIVPGYTGDIPEYVRLLSFREQQSPQTWFSASLHLACAAVLLLIAASQRRAPGGRWSAWALLSMIFVALALDESASLHERLGDWLDMQRAFPDALAFSWLVPGIAFTVLCAAALSRFFWNLPADTRLRFAAAGVTYLTGVVSLEMVAGIHGARYGFDNAAFDLILAAKESLQMAALLVFLNGLLLHVRTHIPGLTIGVAPRAPARPPAPAPPSDQQHEADPVSASK